MAKVLVMKALNDDQSDYETRGVFYRKGGQLQARPPHLLDNARHIVKRAHMAGAIDHEDINRPDVFTRILPGWGNGYQRIEVQEAPTPSGPPD